MLDKDSILAALTIAPGQTVLDAGCGSGYMSKEFSARVGDKGRVFALDPDQAITATLRTEAMGTNIVVVAGDITTTTGLPESSFDLVYLSMVVHGFTSAQLQGLEAEVRRLLVPRGRLAIVEIAKRETPLGPPLELRFSPEELQARLGLTAFATTDVSEHFYLQLFEKG